MNINQVSDISNGEIGYSTELDLLENNSLKEQFQKFKELFENFIKRIDQWMADKKKKSSINDMTHELIANFNEFGISLNQFEKLKNEYYDYSDIQDMSLYILRNEDLINSDNLEFIMGMLLSFIELLQSWGNEDYEEKYKKFQFNLIDFKQYFYSNVYTRSKCYDKEALAEIRNILLG